MAKKNVRSKRRISFSEAQVRLAARKMDYGSWVAVKLCCTVFGILLCVLYPEIITWVDWYWWFIIFILLLAVPVYTLYFNKKK